MRVCDRSLCLPIEVPLIEEIKEGVHRGERSLPGDNTFITLILEKKFKSRKSKHTYMHAYIHTYIHTQTIINSNSILL